MMRGSLPGSVRTVGCALVACAAACGTDDFLVVTIEARPAVHSPATIAVKLSNGSSEVAQNFTVTAASFPASFSVGPNGQTDALTITVEARDAQGLLAGRGIGQVPAGAGSGKIVVEAADFVINTDFAGDQVPSTDYETYGFQIAAAGNGNITTAYRDSSCPTAGCDIFARRFDASGRPLPSQVAAGTNSFKASTRLTSSLASPATAANGDSSIVVWDYDPPGAGTDPAGISCRALNPAGAANQNEVLISAETSPDVVSATGLTNNNFVIAWSAIPGTNREIRGAVVRPDCTLLGIVNTVSDPAVTSTRASVAANQSNIMFAWTVDGSVFVRSYRLDLQPTSAVTNVVTKTLTERVEHVRVAPYAGGFAIVVRWALISGTSGPGRLELFRVNNSGALQGVATLVSERSGSDFDSKQGFGVAARPDGALLIAWHSCNENGDGEGCGVFGRLFSATGTAGDELVLATTTQGNQTRPSVAGLPGAFVALWSDESATDPDRAGSGVRARVVYPDGSGGSTE